jgi:hypothetical protein
MTGGIPSPGGVWGGTRSGSSFWPREKRRLRSTEDEGSASGFGGAVSGLVSAVGLFPSPVLFLGLNTSLSRLEDRFGRSSGGPRVVRLRSRGGADSRLSELSWGSVDALVERSGVACETSDSGL